MSYKLFQDYDDNIKTNKLLEKIFSTEFITILENNPLSL